jgi:hypothetical protein
MPQYNWNIVESGIKHHKLNFILKYEGVSSFCRGYVTYQ